MNSPIVQTFANSGGLLESITSISKGGIYLFVALIFTYFLIIDNLTQHGIYHLPSQKFLLEDQQRIVASSEIDFMMGCNITGELHCWFQDKWTQHSKVEDFDILVDVEGKNGIYYLKQNGKYFLYTFDGKPFANLQIPHGADFVGYDADNKSIVLVNEGKACFL